MTDPRLPATWRLKTKAGIPYRVMDLSLSVEENKASATEILVMPWNYVVAFINESFPPTNNTKGKQAIRRTRYLPGTRLQTSNISAVAFTGGRPIDFFAADYWAPAETYDTLAKVTVQYETKEQEDDQPYKISARASGQVLTSPAPNAKVQGDDGGTAQSFKQPQLPLQIMTPTITWSVEWPSIDRSLFRQTLLPLLRSLVGTINDKKMEIFFGAPEETVLFLGFDFEEEYTNAAVLGMAIGDELSRGEKDPDTGKPLDPRKQAQLLNIQNDLRAEDNREDDKTITLNLHFSEVRKYNRKADANAKAVRGHNHIWNPERGQWEKVYFDDGKPLFPSQNLMSIFSAEIDEINKEN